jgi:hypothetical protein
MTSIDPPDEEIPPSSPPPPADRHKRCVLGPNGPHEIRGEKHYKISTEFWKKIKKSGLFPNTAAGDWACARHGERLRASLSVRLNINPEECDNEEINNASPALVNSPKNR